MTDRELIELAAKAAGMSHLMWTPGGSPIIPGSLRAPGDKVYWNPLTDDGDAFRLAVKLSMIGDSGLAWEFMEAAGDCAATRRAIVRAAAAIGGQQ